MQLSAFVLLLFVCTCSQLIPQTTTGSISGKVIDSLQQALEGATVLTALQ